MGSKWVNMRLCVRVCVHENVLSAIHANMTAYAATHYAPAVDIAVVMCLQGRFSSGGFHSHLALTLADTECVRVGLGYQAPDNCIATWRATAWGFNLPSAISTPQHCQHQHETKARKKTGTLLAWGKWYQTVPNWYVYTAVSKRTSGFLSLCRCRCFTSEGHGMKVAPQMLHEIWLAMGADFYTFLITGS